MNLPKAIAIIGTCACVLPTTAGGEGLRVLRNQSLAVFRPADVFGVAVDGGSLAEAKALFDPKNSGAIRAARFGSVSYRLRTELAGETWHWSSFGRWSDEEHHQGYWVGDWQRNDDHELSFGYRLPRRGNSRDEANDDGFSRIDDGDEDSFWKSNPYLDPKLDGAGTERQWVIADLGGTRLIDAAEIHWAEPYAARFRLQHWVGSDENDGNWRDLTPSTSGQAGVQNLSFRPVKSRFVRILLEQSSHSSISLSRDSRDRMGYAIRELGIGRRSKGSNFLDFIHHQKSGLRQTRMIVSSTDPWHREMDRDPETVQPSPVALHTLGLFAGPFMIPLGLLTDTPENALAELRYFRRRGLPIDRVELGEEPEGQLAPPRMVAGLYERLARLIAGDDADLAIGGPSLIDAVADTTLDDEDESWTRAFLQSLGRLHPSTSIGFLSTELYPVEDLCEPPDRMLGEVASSPRKMAVRLGADGAGGLTRVITEYGLSPYGGAALRGMVSALADAEILATSISHHVLHLYLYGTSPTSAVRGKRECAGAGNLTLWDSDQLGHIVSPSIRLRVFETLRDRWSNPNDAREELLDVAGAPPGLDAFALRRENGSVSILLINRTAKRLAVKMASPKEGLARSRSRAASAKGAGLVAANASRQRKGPFPAFMEVEPQSATVITPADGKIVAARASVALSQPVRGKSSEGGSRRELTRGRRERTAAPSAINKRR